jgi:preprotein translocase SecF subunit
LARPTGRRFFQLVPPDTAFRFVERSKLCVALSLGLLVIAALAIPVRGVRLGVDFAGGYQIVVRVHAQPLASEASVRLALSGPGFADAEVVREGAIEEGVFRLRFSASAGRDPAETAQRVRAALAARAGTVSASIEQADFVGPRVGAELRGQALKALALAFGLIVVYIGVRFAPAYAPGAVVALLHDVAVTAGIFVLFGWEFDMRVMGAFLTIIGYSINDTIVIFDRIRELRAQQKGLPLAAVIDLAVNQTLSRTLLTSGTTLLAVLALLTFGGPVLRGFSIAMAIGILVGTYSSVYVAAPILLWIESVVNGRSGAAREPSRPSGPAAGVGRSAGGSAT